MSIKKKLKKLPKNNLVRLLVSLYGIYDDIDDIIERHSEVEEPTNSGLSELLEKHIQKLGEEDDFIDYYQANDFSCRLGSLLIDINTLLRETNPLAALTLTETFLNTIDPIIGRVDDSDGVIGEIFSSAIDQWLDIAAEIRWAQKEEKIDWVQKVLHFFNTNEYGCFDNIISHSQNLLIEQELIQLAWRFENDAKQALAIHNKNESNNTEDYNRDASHASIGLQSVAEALDDMALFEKATILTSPHPNALQMAHIVEFALAIRNQERAEYWLNQPGWDNCTYQHNILINQLLEQQGNYTQIKTNLLKNFMDNPNELTLEEYWDVANANERRSIIPEVEKRAQEVQYIDEAIAMLFLINNLPLAAQIVLQRAEELAHSHYTQLTSWVETFESDQQILPAILCYRALLTDLLERGYTKAYHHGARYFHQLLKLDKAQPDYQPFDNAQEFVKKIQQKHWRKRSFWAEANYPNKPE